MPRQQKSESKGSGGSKSQARTATTTANVERRARTIARRLERRAQRRRAAATQKVRAKQEARARKKAWKALPSRQRGPSPSDVGMRQFQNQAKGHHLHQREHGLARALTPEEFQKTVKLGKKPAAGDRAKDRELERMLFHVATGNDLED